MKEVVLNARLSLTFRAPKGTSGGKPMRPYYWERSDWTAADDLASKTNKDNPSCHLPTGSLTSEFTQNYSPDARNQFFSDNRSPELIDE